MLVRKLSDGDKTANFIAFARGPQVLATDSLIDSEKGAVKECCWGDSIYTCCARQHGEEREFLLVPFADAGQHKQKYKVVHEGIELD